MSSIELFYAGLGLLSVALIVWLSRDLYRRGGPAGAASALEWVCWLTAAPALLIGWYFNIAYMREYGAAAGWWHWTTLLFVNPASASGGQDLILANLILFPLWTIVDGRRLGMRAPWLYFPMSLLTSYAFAIALFMAVRERQRRANAAVGRGQ
ncbi:DUF2834 domain-containing protein [Solimonas variicoloris]|uniref:DUF2834 domain-containing protein n=1 Tax=Solimonas variicoloris TaxID=254408 RepID=UPI00037EDBEF|nr:DUF2834 domain-containing protein [Solimonas variicoloris]